MKNPADILVVSAHPDDAEFGAAGTVARWVDEGRQVVYLVCTNGDKGTSDRSLSPERLAEIREREQLAAAAVLGVREVIFLRHPDQSLEDTASFRQEIVRWIRELRPRTVVTSDPYRRYVWHRDHRITGQVVLDAVFPLARDHLACPDLLSQGLEPHKVSEILFWGAEDINHRSDVTRTFDRKMAALRCHESQMREFSKPQMEAWLRDRCLETARDEPFDLAEGFHRVVLPP
ncbi:MAG: PIG-L deacetylase family protein [bacterium]